MQSVCSRRRGKAVLRCHSCSVRDKKRVNHSHGLRDFRPVVNHHGDKNRHGLGDACIHEATVHPWRWLHPRDLGHLTVSTIGRTADSQPDTVQLGCDVKSSDWETRMISRPASASVDQREDDHGLDAVIVCWPKHK